MLQLNIKSKDYMCLDIDPGWNALKNLLRSKLYRLTEYLENHKYDPITFAYPGKYNYYESPDILQWFTKFHISLGTPKKEINAETINNNFCHIDMVPIVGDVLLAPICISKKDNKLSAWIPLNVHWITEAVTKYLGDPTWKDLNLDHFDSFDHRCNECPVQHLHVTIANLTGNPHDSIARPEDCIIDTITT